MALKLTNTQSVDQLQSSLNFDQLQENVGAIRGKDFIVVCKLGGWTEVYDFDYNLIATEVFLNIKELSADEYITVSLRNGWSEIYDKQFNMQSIKYYGE